MNYQRLIELGNKIRYGTATAAEKEEYMYQLYLNGSITEQQYSDYKSNKNREDILKAALGIGAVLLVGYLLSELFSKK